MNKSHSVVTFSVLWIVILVALKEQWIQGVRNWVVSVTTTPTESQSAGVTNAFVQGLAAAEKQISNAQVGGGNSPANYNAPSTPSAPTLPATTSGYTNF